ncbi:hypothetical protein QBC46DRAFT_136488 [Diplogelasinospora grovesii]|uniref:Chromatin modification-related protein n=1 Tax=Diplogelasinospora grovesii TaxID=303347 RepID=A0AAN6S4F7_9PEZI|nr:hypothetical protein QBC46DRAFT_136488 [Diplogelasinospora grovesii]
MPRDDLSIDFVKKMPPVEALDPAQILDEWINRTQNLPEEIRFLQDEITEKDRQYDRLIKEIEERDGRIQKWIKANGSHQHNPKEEEYRALIRKNFAQAEQLANEKIGLSQKLQQTMDKHIRHLDIQIKMLYDRAEPGFTDPDELPSLVRPSAANITNNTPVIRGGPATNPVTSALQSISLNTSGSAIRSSNPQIRNAQALQHPASAPATPAASIILNRQARESSAGPGSGVPKRGPRSNTGILSNLPTTSSGLARHSSLGPGTPKAHHTVISVQRAGSAGPRGSFKAGGVGSSTSRKTVGTPSSVSGGGGGARKGKGTPAEGGRGTNKSGLSRVKRAAKNSASSTNDSELSDAETGSADDSGRSRRGTPAPAVPSNRALSNQGSNLSSNKDGKEGSNDRESLGGASVQGRSGGNTTRILARGRGVSINDDDDDDEDAMELDEDEASDDKKYCICQNVSFGDMVACDNDDCPFEWFHWSCVGLKSEPNGTWYCPVCTENMKKKGGGGGGGGRAWS